jgi:hypothetical protein
MISAINNWRARATQILYGDQATFVRRDLFTAIGGFPDVERLEDVMLCEKVRAVTRVHLLDAAVTTDARKFIRMGPWKSLARVTRILLCHRFSLPITDHIFFTDIR